MFDHKGLVRSSPSTIDGDALVLVTTAVPVTSRTLMCHDRICAIIPAHEVANSYFLGAPIRRLQALCSSTPFLSPMQARGSKAITLLCVWQSLAR